MKSYYSALFDLSQKPTVVIGGGLVAERKINTLLESESRIAVISPKTTDELVKLASEEKISILDRNYQTGDLKNYFLVIIATDNSETNLQIYEDVNHKTQFVNIVDAPELCTFIVPATIDRGLLHIAVSTKGASPGLSKKIREELEEKYNQDYEKYTIFLAEMRKWIFKQNLDIKARKYFFNELLNDEWLEKTSNELIDDVVSDFKKLFNKEINKNNG